MARIEHSNPAVELHADGGCGATFSIGGVTITCTLGARDVFSDYTVTEHAYDGAELDEDDPRFVGDFLVVWPQTVTVQEQTHS